MRSFALFFSLWATAVSAQLTVEGPQPIYNGQNVSAIDLISNPHRDTDPLQPLVQQKAGEPYAEEKVEASIAALQRTGQFTKVEVSVVPEITELRLNFILEPA